MTSVVVSVVVVVVEVFFFVGVGVEVVVVVELLLDAAILARPGLVLLAEDRRRCVVVDLAASDDRSV